MDFTTPHAIGERIAELKKEPHQTKGYDHCYVLRGQDGKLALAARAKDPASGRVMEISTTEPAIQLYCGNFLDGTFVGKHGHLYRMGDGIALEPQKFPDAPNQPKFASARIDPAHPYRHVMVYRVSVER